METSLVTRGDPSLYTVRAPAEKIHRPESRGLPVRSLPSQTREGFYAKQALGTLEAGTAKGPTKLKTISAQGLAVKPADHLAVKSAAAMKK
ncbi:MAG: hypothetical protein U1F66_09755 [bacterium]